MVRAPCGIPRREQPHRPLLVRRGAGVASEQTVHPYEAYLDLGAHVLFVVDAPAHRVDGEVLVHALGPAEGRG